MPRYEVTEQRMYESIILIESDNEKDAELLRGEILDEVETDSYGYKLVSIEKVDDNAEFIS